MRLMSISVCRFFTVRYCCTISKCISSIFSDSTNMQDICHVPEESVKAEDRHDVNRFRLSLTTRQLGSQTERRSPASASCTCRPRLSARRRAPAVVNAAQRRRTNQGARRWRRRVAGRRRSDPLILRFGAIYGFATDRQIIRRRHHRRRQHPRRVGKQQPQSQQLSGKRQMDGVAEHSTVPAYKDAC